jgi:hypothetical protein
MRRQHSRRHDDRRPLPQRRRSLDQQVLHSHRHRFWMRCHCTTKTRRRLTPCHSNNSNSSGDISRDNSNSNSNSSDHNRSSSDHSSNNSDHSSSSMKCDMVDLSRHAQPPRHPELRTRVQCLWRTVTLSELQSVEDHHPAVRTRTSTLHSSLRTRRKRCDLPALSSCIKTHLLMQVLVLLVLGPHTVAPVVFVTRLLH